jgi:hypothetical protein
MTRKQASEHCRRISNGAYKGRHKVVRTFVRKLVGDKFVREYCWTVILINSNGKKI